MVRERGHTVAEGGLDCWGMAGEGGICWWEPIVHRWKSVGASYHATIMQEVLRTIGNGRERICFVLGRVVAIAVGTEVASS